MSEPPTPDGDLFHEETDDPLLADRRDFFKVELWTRDGLRIERLLLAGNSLDKARAVFGAFTKKRPRARLTIRQRTQVLQQCPPARALTVRFSRP